MLPWIPVVDVPVPITLAMTPASSAALTSHSSLQLGTGLAPVTPTTVDTIVQIIDPHLGISSFLQTLRIHVTGKVLALEAVVMTFYYLLVESVLVVRGRIVSHDVWRRYSSLNLHQFLLNLQTSVSVIWMTSLHLEAKSKNPSKIITSTVVAKINVRSSQTSDITTLDE